MLLHTDAFTHKGFHTQRLLHTDIFTHRRFDTQTLWHTDTFTHRHFNTQRLLHTEAFMHRDRTLEIAILPQFLPIEPHFVRKGSNWTREITILPQILAIEPHFVRKGCYYWTPEIANITSVFVAMACERVAIGRQKSQFYRSFWRSNLMSCERVAIGRQKSQFYFSFWRSNLISCERVATGTREIAFWPQDWILHLIQNLPKCFNESMLLPHTEDEHTCPVVGAWQGQT